RPASASPVVMPARYTCSWRRAVRPARNFDAPVSGPVSVVDALAAMAEWLVVGVLAALVSLLLLPHAAVTRAMAATAPTSLMVVRFMKLLVFLVIMSADQPTWTSASMPGWRSEVVVGAGLGEGEAEGGALAGERPVEHA